MPKARNAATRHTCQVCGKPKSISELVPASLVRPNIVDRIVLELPSWSAEGYICLTDLNRFRTGYIRWLLEHEKGELSSLEQSVLESISRHETLSSDVDAEFEQKLTWGERIADRVADFGGSWTFILMFIGFMAVWMGVNAYVLATRPFDPYPFILLNLVLSCLAALQAPVIMMSQNRVEARDRLRSQHDYRVNLKAELEIRHLHEKLDYLLQHQWERLMEIQEIQIELMNEMTRGRR